MALLRAGADVSAMIGIPIPEKINSRWPGNIYAVKENDWASTVLDFAVLVSERIDQKIFPSSMPNHEQATVTFFKQRSLDIIERTMERSSENAMKTKSIKNGVSTAILLHLAS